MSAVAATPSPAHRYQAAIVGGDPAHPIARHRYALGMAWEPKVYIASLLEGVPQTSMVFEARDFDHAFARALIIGTNMAEDREILRDGVLVSLIECDTPADIGIDAD